MRSLFLIILFVFFATKLWGDEESRLHLKRVNYFEHLLKFDATSISDSVFRFNIRVVKIGKFWWEEVKIIWVSHQQISVEEGDWVGSRFSTVDPRSHQGWRSHKVFVHILLFIAVGPDFQKLGPPTGKVLVFHVYIANWMTHNSPKIEKYLFPGISGCILATCTGGPSESSCQEDSEYVWQRGVGSKKSLVMGGFWSVPFLLIESCP